MMEDQPFIGDWYCERKLGSGAFGEVTLWKNKKTKESVAIKKCHKPEGPTEAVEKFRERWENEISLMTETVKNENIVSTIKIKPESFMQELMKRNPSKMKILAMEYCEGGDLRKVLFQPQNCSGLKETEIRSILKSLRSAISYLHSLKITHRDIKPENIVLKKYGDITVYKLTDLGYARALDIQSINASLVGTTEYLAPELIHNAKYNNSVDFWSMGVIAFEIICGVRPFIPHASIAQWILQLKQKSSEHICILENNDGKYEYLNKLLTENQITNCLKSSLEKWLMLALEWNPKQRGHVFEFLSNNNEKIKISDKIPDKISPNSSFKAKSVKFADETNNNPQAPVQVLKIFTMLDQIFDMKILTIFSLYTYEMLSYKIDENTTMDLLKEWIEEEIGIIKNDIIFILPLEQVISEIITTTKPIDLYLSNFYENPMLYLIKKPSIGNKNDLILSEKIIPKIPYLIKMLLENDKIPLKHHILKQYANNCYYFIKKEKKLYEMLMDGVKNYILTLDHEITIYKSKINEMICIGYSARGSFDIMSNTLIKSKEKLSAKSLDNLNQNCILWDEQCIKLKNNLIKLCEAIDKITIRYESVLRRSKESVCNKIVENTFWESYDISLLKKLFEDVRSELYNKTNDEKSHKKLLVYIYESLKKRDSLLRDKDFMKLQKTITDVKIEFDEIKKTVEKASIQSEKYRNDVNKMNSDVLDNVFVMMEQFNQPTDILLHNNYDLLPNVTDEMSQMNLSGFKSLSKSPSFKLNSIVSASIDHPTIKQNDLLCFGEGPDIESLISANEAILDATDHLIEDGFKSLSEMSLVNSIQK